MRINLGYKFHNLDSSVIMQNAEKVLDLKEIILGSLVAPAKEPNDVKVLKYNLATKLYNSPEIAEVTLEEVELIKASLPFDLSPVITGQALACLDINGSEPHWPDEYTEVKLDTENDGIV